MYSQPVLREQHLQHKLLLRASLLVLVSLGDSLLLKYRQILLPPWLCCEWFWCWVALFQNKALLGAEGKTCVYQQSMMQTAKKISLNENQKKQALQDQTPNQVKKLWCPLCTMAMHLFFGRVLSARKMSSSTLCLAAWAKGGLSEKAPGAMRANIFMWRWTGGRSRRAKLS